MDFCHDLIQIENCQSTMLILTTYKTFRAIVKKVEKSVVVFLLQVPSDVCLPFLQLPSHLLAAITT